MRTRINHIFRGGKAAAYHTNQQHKFLHRLHMTYFDPVSLAAVRKDCRIKKSDFIKLLGKFEEMGVGGVSC